jgi:regulator of protease activity HflC (stomatin/prohibitin superfamily)
MKALVIVIVVVIVLFLLALALSARIVKQYEQGVLFRLGRVQGEASDIMMAHPLALQLRNLQSLVEIGVDKNTTVVFPAPLMTTIAELGSFLAREQAAATPPPLTAAVIIPPPQPAAGNGTASN